MSHVVGTFCLLGQCLTCIAMLETSNTRENELTNVNNYENLKFMTISMSQTQKEIISQIEM